MPSLKATKDFQHGRGLGAPFITAGQTFETDPARAAELVANGLAEAPDGAEMPQPVRAAGSALPPGSILPPVQPVVFGDAVALAAHRKNAERKAERGEKPAKVEPVVIPTNDITAPGQMEAVAASPLGNLPGTAPDAAKSEAPVVEAPAADAAAADAPKSAARSK